MFYSLNLGPEVIPSLCVVIAWLSFMRSVRRSGYIFALFSLCATAIHEACHWTCGFVLCAKPVSISLLPRRHGNLWVLGSVGFTNLSLWNAAFVAFAPLGMLPLGLLVLQHWMLPAYIEGAYVSWFSLGYVVACCFISCLPSTTDIRVGASSALMYLGIGYGLWRVCT